MSAKEEADLEDLLGAAELGISDIAEFEVGTRMMGVLLWVMELLE